MPSTRTPNSRQAATSVDSTRRYPSEPIPVTVCPARIAAPRPSGSLCFLAPLRGALEAPPSFVARSFVARSSVQAAPRPSGSLCFLAPLRGALGPFGSSSPRAPFQEADHQPVELVELFHLRPVPAAAEHVQLRPADQLERHQRAVEGVH